jgi:hypothetical protein
LFFYKQEINHPKSQVIHPKDALRLVDCRGKLLATLDGWFVSYLEILIRFSADLMVVYENL